MDDFISRQDAIDAILADKIDAISLKVMTALGDGRLALTLNDACDRHIRDIEQLPSAKPEPLTEAEVIICKMYLDDLDKYKTCNEYKLLMGLLDGTASAQPEITHCKDCIHWINKHLCEIWSRYGTIETKPDFYCGNGQKRGESNETN